MTTHVGVGNILTARRAAHRAFVVARLLRDGGHVNDHPDKVDRWGAQLAVGTGLLS